MRDTLIDVILFGAPITVSLFALPATLRGVEGPESVLSFALLFLFLVGPWRILTRICIPGYCTPIKFIKYGLALYGSCFLIINTFLIWYARDGFDYFFAFVIVPVSPIFFVILSIILKRASKKFT